MSPADMCTYLVEPKPKSNIPTHTNSNPQPKLPPHLPSFHQLYHQTIRVTIPNQIQDPNPAKYNISSISKAELLPTRTYFSYPSPIDCRRKKIEE